MLRRLALAFLLLSLPFRLWAGAGMMVGMSGFEAASAVTHASVGMPACHEMQTDRVTEPVQATGHGSCHTCQLCSWAVWPQISLVPSLAALSIRYIARLNVAMTSADLARQIKPPISLS